MVAIGTGPGHQVAVVRGDAVGLPMRLLKSRQVIGAGGACVQLLWFAVAARHAAPAGVDHGGENLIVDAAQGLTLVRIADGVDTPKTLGVELGDQVGVGCAHSSHSTRRWTAAVLGVQWIPVPTPANIQRWFTPDTLHPALLAIGRSRQRRARTGLDQHQHGALEVCLIDGGAVDWVIDDHPLHIPPDGIFITRPGQRHGSLVGSIQPCTLRWFQCDPRRLDDPHLARRVAGLGGWHASGGRALAPHLDGIIAELVAPGPDARDVIGAYLVLLLTGLLRRAAGNDAPPRLPRPLERVCAAIADAPAEPPSVGRWCRIAGVGRSRLHRLFHDHLGTSPVAWLHRQRIAAAYPRLQRGEAVTVIALDLGYASSQHFARTFKALVGVTPSSWTARH